MELEGKKVLVVGIARSGVAAARLLASRGAMVIANDIRNESALVSEVEQLREAGVMISLGSHPESLFDNADLIVLSPGVPGNIAPLQIARRAGIKIISEVELASRFLRGRWIGITGSNGKTTTTALINELMRAAGAKTIVGGNIGTALTSMVEASSDDSWIVAELSSFQLEEIEKLRPEVALITNITPDHLDRYDSLDDYVRAKHRIFMNQSGSDWAVLNGQDPTINEMVLSMGVPSKRVYFSSRGSGTLSGERAGIYVSGDRIVTTLLAEGDSEIDVIALEDISIPGMHNVENVMAALAVTFCAKEIGESDLPALRDAIKGFKGVEHRIEFVAEIDGVKFYNDSKATNVDSTIKALEAFAGNLILILGGKDKGSDYTLLETLVQERVKQIILIGAASDKILGQLEGTRPMTRASSMEDAVMKSLERAVPGDTVLLSPACASYDMFDNYEHRGRVFKEAVLKLTKRLDHGESGAVTM